LTTTVVTENRRVMLSLSDCNNVQNVEKDIERAIVDMLFQNVTVLSPLNGRQGQKVWGV
jgi:hypothetical protein